MQIAALHRFRSVRRRLHPTRRRLSGTRAAVAIEFAILAPLFLSALLAIVDVGLLLSSQALLDTAMTDAARLIRTGQASSNGAVFGSQLCSEVSTLMACSGLRYRVQIGNSFSAMSGSYTLGSNGTPNGFSSYPASVVSGNSGGSLTNDFVVVQVAYRRPWMFTLLGTMMGRSTELLLSTAVFENEPTP
jgi:Flp pilus assembly protein TadG